MTWPTFTLLITCSPGCHFVSQVPEILSVMYMTDPDHGIADHTEEATKYIKEVLGEYYLTHQQYWIPNLWHNFQQCQFIEDEGLSKSNQQKNSREYSFI